MTFSQQHQRRLDFYTHILIRCKPGHNPAKLKPIIEDFWQRAGKTGVYTFNDEGEDWAKWCLVDGQTEVAAKAAFRALNVWLKAEWNFESVYPSDPRFPYISFGPKGCFARGDYPALWQDD